MSAKKGSVRSLEFDDNVVFDIDILGFSNPRGTPASKLATTPTPYLALSGRREIKW